MFGGARSVSIPTSVEQVRQEVVLPVHGGEHERREAPAGGGVHPSPGLQELRGEGPVSMLGGHQESAFRLSRKWGGGGGAGGKQTVKKADGVALTFFIPFEHSRVSSFLSYSHVGGGGLHRMRLSRFSREHARNRGPKGPPSRIEANA